MRTNHVPRSAVIAAALLFVAAVAPATAQIRSDWSTPVNLTALNSSSLDA